MAPAPRIEPVLAMMLTCHNGIQCVPVIQHAPVIQHTPVIQCKTAIRLPYNCHTTAINVLQHRPAPRDDEALCLRRCAPRVHASQPQPHAPTAALRSGARVLWEGLGRRRQMVETQNMDLKGRA